MKQPHNMDIETIRGEERCELCGALKTAEGVDIKASWGAVEAMRRLADIWLQDPIALGIVLARVAMPTASYRDLGVAVGSNHVEVQRKLSALRAYMPCVAAFAESKNAHAQARKRRRVSYAR